MILPQIPIITRKYEPELSGKALFGGNKKYFAMTRIILLFGAIIGIINVTMFFISFLGGGIETSMEYGELIGYTTMIISLSAIFFAVRQYRDNHLGGQIKFGKAFLIGILITVVAGLVYTIGWEIYYQNGGSEFTDMYLEQLRAGMAEDGMTEAEIDAQLASQEDMMQAYKENIAVRMGITFMEIFPVGLLVSLIVGLVYGVFLKPKEE